MRKTLKVIKYRYDENMSQQKIANALNISRGAVRDYLSRFNATGLSWLDVKELSDRELELLLFPKVDTIKSECPDWAYIHTEMVTTQHPLA